MLNFRRNINIQNRNNNLFLTCTISFALLLLTLSFATSEYMKKTLAVSIIVSDNNIKTNKSNNITTSSNERSISNSNKVWMASPFYEAKGKVISNTSIGLTSINQTAVIVVEKGSINGIGNITNFESWIFPYTSSTNMLAFGHGVITTMGKQMISWIGYDKHSIPEKNGTTIYQGKIFFNNSSSKGNLASINNMKGLYITNEHHGTNGNEQTTKMWKIGNNGK